VVRDITERKRVEAKLVQLAQYDALTGLPNRALFMDRLVGATLRANRAKSALAVLFLDLDGFKKINDTLGHHSGDQLLKKFGERLSASVRKTDTVARLAGDEFTIILEKLADPEADTRAVADKIVAAMHHPFELADGGVSVTTSIGIAIHAGAGANVDALLRLADDAMYRAKFSGKNRWSV
jgi:diguanylate cyclase (GGDEF)-like protein